MRPSILRVVIVSLVSLACTRAVQGQAPADSVGRAMAAVSLGPGLDPRMFADRQRTMRAALDRRANRLNGPGPMVLLLAGPDPSALVAARVDLERACESGRFETCPAWIVAEMLVSPGSVDVELRRRAATAAWTACQRGVDAACALALPLTTTALAGQNPVPPSEVTARVESGCTRGNLASCAVLALHFDVGGAEVPNPGRAAPFVRRLCQAGETAFCVREAQLLFEGIGGAADHAGALRLLREACSSRFAWGCRELAEAVAEGRGGAPSLDGAIELLERACSPAEPDDCVRLGELELSAGGARATQGATRLRSLCEQGQIRACRLFANAQQRGTGVRRDARAAFALLQTKCFAGDVEACRGLGEAYRDGIGTRRNRDLANVYLRRACGLDDAEACSAIGTRSLFEPPAPVGGMIPPEVIRDAIRAHLGEVSRCYANGLVHDRRLAGRVSVRFAIGPDGAVVSSAVRSTTLNHLEVEECIADAVLGWRFEASGGRVLVTYPFTLTPE